MKKKRRSTPYLKIRDYYYQGLSDLEIAQKTGTALKGKDKAHYLRAILSSMRLRGFIDETGKRKYLETRKEVRKMAAKKSKSNKKDEIIVTPSMLRYKLAEYLALVDKGGKTLVIQRRGRVYGRLIPDAA